MAPNGVVSDKGHVADPAAIGLVLGVNPLMS